MKDGAELVVSETPVVGDAVAAKEAIQGTNIYGEEVGGVGRASALLTFIPGGGLAKKAAEGWGRAFRFAADLGGSFGSSARKLDNAVESTAKKADGGRFSNQGNPAEVPSAKGGAGPVRKGQAGEDAVRGAYDIGPKTKIDVNGKNRFPDGLTADVLSEVKNVKQLGYTQQLRDYAQFAQDTGRRFDLYVPGSTTSNDLSGPLNEAINSGVINLRPIPGT